MRLMPWIVCISGITFLQAPVRSEEEMPDYYGTANSESSTESTPAVKKQVVEKNSSTKGTGEKSNSKKPKREIDPKSARALRMRLKDLKDPNPEIRASACELLADLGSPDSVLPLIEMLNPDRKEPDKVLRLANASLAKITNQNFGYKAYPEWKKWWAANKEAFYKKTETGASPNDKIAGETSNTRGREYMKIGQYSQAYSFFLDAIDRDSSVVDYHNNIGLCLIHLGKYLDAMIYFEEAIALDADCAEAYMNVGRCYSFLSKTIEAQSWFKKASDHDPDGKLWDLKWTIGKEYMQRGEWKLAFEFVDTARAKAEKFNIFDPRMHNDLAIIHYGLDQYQTAWKELTNVRTLGYEPNKDFEAKVRKAVIDNGGNPDEDDRKAREVLRTTNTVPATPK